jgi:hypothetical protein
MYVHGRPFESHQNEYYNLLPGIRNTAFAVVYPNREFYDDGLASCDIRWRKELVVTGKGGSEKLSGGGGCDSENRKDKTIATQHQETGLYGALKYGYFPGGRTLSMEPATPGVVVLKNDREASRVNKNLL